MPQYLCFICWKTRKLLNYSFIDRLLKEIPKFKKRLETNVRKTTISYLSMYETIHSISVFKFNMEGVLSFVCLVIKPVIS